MVRVGKRPLINTFRDKRGYDAIIPPGHPIVPVYPRPGKDHMIDHVYPRNKSH
jgi:hypothetical protein